MSTVGIKPGEMYQQLFHLQETQLFDLARNGSASLENRKVAAQILRDKGYEKANSIEVERLSYVAPVDAETKPQVAAPTGPLVASVTTATMSKDEVIPEPIRAQVLAEHGRQMVKDGLVVVSHEDLDTLLDATKTVQKMETDGKA